MSKIEVKDPAEWRAGDTATVVIGRTMATGPLVPDWPGATALYVESIGVCVRDERPTSVPKGCTVTVTREVEDIPEPAGLSVLVEFEDGTRAVRAAPYVAVAWRIVGGDCWWSWAHLVRDHGPAVAVLSPGWEAAEDVVSGVLGGVGTIGIGPERTEFRHQMADAILAAGFRQGPVSVSRERVEAYCEIMHDAYEAAAVTAGWETQARSRKPWSDVPEANKMTMRVAVAALLDALGITVRDE